MIRTIATRTDSSVTVPVVRSAVVNAKMAGTNRPIRARTRSAALETAILALKVWTPFRNPPTRTAAPITSSRLPMIEPVSDAWTTSIRPRWRAKNAMISSAMLPNVALRMPPTWGPVSDPSRSVERPTTQARPRMDAADEDEQERRVGVQPEVEDDRRRRSGARSRSGRHAPASRADRGWAGRSGG